MSIDNGVYIAEFPTLDGQKEYRVIEAQAIENVDYGSKDEQDHTRVLYFKDAKSFSTCEEADKEAQVVYNKAIEDYGMVEYGIRFLSFDRPLLAKTVKEAQEWLDKCWNIRQAKYQKVREEFDGVNNKVWSDPRIIAVKEKMASLKKEYVEIEKQVKEECGWYEAEKKYDEAYKGSEQ